MAAILLYLHGAGAMAEARAAGATVRFPDAAAPARLDRPAKALALEGGGPVELSFWRFEPAPGRSQARNAYWCGVVVEGQPLTVVGVGETEAVSCDGLSEAGGLPGGGVGLIYRTASPNARGLTAVVLTRAGRRWAVDEAATARLSTASPRTLAAMRRLFR